MAIGNNPITTGEWSAISSMNSRKVNMSDVGESTGNAIAAWRKWREEQNLPLSESMKRADESIVKAGDVLPLYKERYIDQNPYADFYERARTGTLAMLGRQATINREQLTAALERSGLGSNAFRKVMQRRALDTEIAYRYIDAEAKLAGLGLEVTDKARNALQDYMDMYLKLGRANLSSYSVKLANKSNSFGIKLSPGSPTGNVQYPKTLEEAFKNINRRDF